jgi:hypothetical protein
MASQLKVDTLTGVTTAGSIAVTGEGNSTTTNLQQGLCKSWINFDMVSSFSARDSFNHSSETDNGTGDVTLTVASLFSNVNYSHVGMGGHGDTALIAVMQPINLTAPTTSAARYQIAYVNGTIYDADLNCIWNAGDLA